MGKPRRSSAQPSEDFDRQIDELAVAFGTTAAAISTAIAAEAATNQVGEAGQATISALAGATQTALAALLSVSVGWINETLPAVYAHGVRDAGSAVGSAGAGDAANAQDELRRGADEAMGRLEHRNAIAAAQRELASELSSALDGIGRDADRALAEIRRRNVARALAQDAPLGNALAEDFAGEMRDRGIRFKDRAGRKWDAEAYARTVLRTNVATALNAGHLNRAIELGSRYVAVFDGGPGDVDEPCIRANGQVWHVAVAAANMLEHPNCRRSFAALDPTYSGPVDRDLDELAQSGAA